MGLRAKVTLALLVLALVPLAVTAGVVAYINLERLKLSTKEYRLATADVVVAEVGNLMDRGRSELETIAKALSQTSRPLPERLELAKVSLLGNSFVRRVGVYNPAGERVDSLRVKERSNPVEMPGSLSDALRGVSRTEGVAYLGTEITRGKAAHLPIIVPMFKGDDKIYGYLWTAVSLEALGKAVGLVSQRRFGQKQDRVYILDDRLTVVVHAAPAELGQDMHGKGIAVGLAGGRLPRTVGYAAAWSRCRRWGGAWWWSSQGPRRTARCRPRSTPRRWWASGSRSSR